jgi:hypothetical protein
MSFGIRCAGRVLHAVEQFCEHRAIFYVRVGDGVRIQRDEDEVRWAAELRDLVVQLDEIIFQGNRLGFVTSTLLNAFRQRWPDLPKLP